MKTEQESRHDPRAGTRWLAGIDDRVRLQMVAALLSRFNHDARTPLNTMLGWSHLLQQPNATERTARAAEVIARSINDQSLMLDEFVDDGRVLVGVLAASPSTAAARDLMDTVIARLADVVQLHRVALRPTLELDGVAVRGDTARLQRLIFRVLAAVVRRAADGAIVHASGQVEQAFLEIRADAPSAADDWSVPALLDLRLATLHADLCHGQLDVESSPGRAKLILRLPLA